MKHVLRLQKISARRELPILALSLTSCDSQSCNKQN